MGSRQEKNHHVGDRGDKYKNKFVTAGDEADWSSRRKWQRRFVFADAVGQMKLPFKCHEADASLKYTSPILPIIRHTF